MVDAVRVAADHGLGELAEQVGARLPELVVRGSGSALAQTGAGVEIEIITRRPWRTAESTTRSSSAKL